MAIDLERMRQAIQDGRFDGCNITTLEHDDSKITRFYVDASLRGDVAVLMTSDGTRYSYDLGDLCAVEGEPQQQPFGLDEEALFRLAACGWSPQDVVAAWTQILNAYGRPNLDTESRVCFNGGTEGRKARPRRETQMNRIDQVALDIIDAIGNDGGEFEREPGQVLHALAEATGHEYKEVSLGVLYLERMEMVEVDRADAPEAQRANRLVRIRLI